MTRAIVIGGGIAGLSVAARLAHEVAVTVLEAEPALGIHASGRSAAVFEENYGAAPVVALNKASRAFYTDGGYLTQRGLMLLCKAGEDTAFEADLVTLDCAEITLEEARKMVPILNDQITRAGYHAGAYDIDTDRVLQDFAREVRAQGGQIKTKAKVEKIERRGDVWHVHTPQGSFEAELLINAAGAWADAVAALARLKPIGLTPLRRSMARIPAPEGFDTRPWPMFFGPGESWYAKPDAGALIISPAEEDPQAPCDAWADDMVIAEGIARYSAYIRPEVTRVETTWAGLRSFAPDRVLVLGPDPDHPQFIWCAGQGGYGFATAPAASQLTADLALGRKPQLAPDVVAALSPERLRQI